MNYYKVPSEPVWSIQVGYMGVSITMIALMDTKVMQVHPQNGDKPTVDNVHCQRPHSSY